MESDDAAPSARCMVLKSPALLCAILNHAIVAGDGDDAIVLLNAEAVSKPWRDAIEKSDLWHQALTLRWPYLSRSVADEKSKAAYARLHIEEEENPDCGLTAASSSSDECVS